LVKARSSRVRRCAAYLSKLSLGLTAGKIVVSNGWAQLKCPAGVAQRAGRGAVLQPVTVVCSRPLSRR